MSFCQQWRAVGPVFARRLMCIGLVLAFATGCVHNPDDRGGSAGVEAPFIGSDPTPGVDYIRYEDWRPTTIVQNDPLSEEEARRLAREWAENNRRNHGFDENFPLPEFVAWSSELGFGQEYVDCMASFGINVSLGPLGDLDLPGGWEIGSGSPVEAALVKCDAMYPHIGSLYPPSEDVERVIYEFYREFFIPCMQAHGIEFIIEPPPKEVWVQQRRGQIHTDGPNWAPSNMYTNWSKEARKYYEKHEDLAIELFKECPRRPPAQYLFGFESFSD